MLFAPFDAVWCHLCSYRPMLFCAAFVLVVVGVTFALSKCVSLAALGRKTLFVVGVEVFDHSCFQFVSVFTIQFGRGFGRMLLYHAQPGGSPQGGGLNFCCYCRVH
jgi:hypothetical protein